MSNLYEQLIYNINKAIKNTIFESSDIDKGFIMLYPEKFSEFIYDIDHNIKHNGIKMSLFIQSDTLNYIISHYPYIYGDIQDNQYYVIYGNNIEYKKGLFSMAEFEKTLKLSGIINKIKNTDNNEEIYICNNGIFCKYTKNSITYWCLIAPLSWFDRRGL